MKKIKIIVGFLLLYGLGVEFVHAGRSIGTFLSPVIILTALVLILISTWLIGSGFSDKKFKIKSFEFVKYFIISIVVFTIVGFISS